MPTEEVVKLYKSCFLTAGSNKLIFWGTAQHLKHCMIQPKYNEKQKYFEFPLFPSVIDHLKIVVPNIQIDERLLSYTTELKSRFEQFESLKSSQDCNGLSDVGLKPVDLYPHQKISSKINELFPRMLCLDEMGLGKTLVAIRTALYRKLHCDNKRCLIICPNSIKLTVWAKEISNRTHMGYCVPTGTSKRREKLIKQFLTFNTVNPDYYFMVINFKMASKFLDLLKEFVDGQMLIIDESQYMKNLASQRTKAIFKLEPKYVLSMTGTPFHNHLEDIFSLAEFVWPLIFGGSFTYFKDQYCVESSIEIPVKTKNSKHRTIRKKVIRGYKNTDNLREKLELISYRRTKKDVLDLPEKTYENRLINMTTEQWKHYEAMCKQCYVLIEQTNKDEIESVANGILAKMLRLSQIADGYLTDFADKSRSYWIEKGGKLVELDELLEQIVDGYGQKVVIWSRFVEVIRFLSERYAQKYGAVAIHGGVATQQRADIVDQFQTDSNTKVFLAQIQSCGVGMTLHSACYEIFYDKCFIPSSSIIQAEDRCHRIGMGDKCTIISLIAQGTVDEHWEEILSSKLSAADEILFDDKAEQRSKAEEIQPRFSKNITKEQLLNLIKIGQKGGV